MILLFIAIILFALIMLRVPIAIAIGIIALVGMIEQRGSGAIYDAALKLFEGSTSVVDARNDKNVNGFCDSNFKKYDGQ